MARGAGNPLAQLSKSGGQGADIRSVLIILKSQAMDFLLVPMKLIKKH